jgi:hypothetical protein
MTSELGNCGFCYESFDGTRGTKATHRVWSKDFSQYIHVCAKHAETMQANDYAETLSPPMVEQNRRG